MITFERFWAIFAGNQFKIRQIVIKRNKTQLNIMILILLITVCFANFGNLTYFAFYYTVTINNQPSVINGTNYNYTISSRSSCLASSSSSNNINSIFYNFVRLLTPVVIMIILNALIIAHLNKSKKKVNVNNSRTQKKENHYTIAVSIINGLFLILCLPQFIAILTRYASNYFTLTTVYNAQINCLVVLTLIISYCFSLFSFWLDMSLNKLFRNEFTEFYFPCIGKKVGAMTVEKSTAHTGVQAGQTKTDLPLNQIILK